MTQTPDPHPDPKADLRRLARQRRRAIDPAAAAHAAQAAARHLGGYLRARFGADLPVQALSGYVAHGSELDALPSLRAHPGPVGLPVVTAPDAPLLFRAWTPDAALETGAHGIAQPVCGAAMRPDVVLVPLLAFDARGVRLGQGGGYYDRTLQALRRSGPVLAIGYAFASQQMPDLPAQPHDERLDMIVTDQGVIIPR